MLKKRIYFAFIFLILGTQASYASFFDDVQWSMQRDIYVQADKALRKGDKNTYFKLRERIKDYPLTPYLDNRIFFSELDKKSTEEVHTYLEKHKSFPFTNTLYNRYLAKLGQKKKWDAFLTLQKTPPRTESYQCYFYRAKLASGDKKTAWEGARKLWSTGYSVSKACDPLFKAWKLAKNRSDQDIIDRMFLAFSSRNRSLLKYLSEQLSLASQGQGKLMLTLYDHPDRVQKFSKKQKVTSFYQRLTKATFKRLASKKPLQAMKQYELTVEGQHFNDDDRQQLADYVARRLVQTDNEEAKKWRDNVILQSSNEVLIEKRIIEAIENANWTGVLYWIDVLPEKAQQEKRWVFWKAHISDKNGKKDEAQKLYNSILGERDFYSMSAAIELGKPIEFPVKQLDSENNKEILSQYQSIFERVREFLLLEKLEVARYEWQYALNKSDPEVIPFLAQYAVEQGWNHLGVLATIKGRMWDYLTLRFPLAYEWWFEFFSNQRNMSQTTLMAIARQESALFPKARSHVGARGLMQLMPYTAKSTAKKIGYDSYSVEGLYQADTNIRLGSAYLKEMLELHADNRILAFASYNAGPHRVKSWLKRSNGELDVYAFIDMIPFRETKGYVQNALMFDLYYQQILGKSTYLLTPNERQRKY